MALQDVSQDVGQPKVAIFNDPKVRGWVYQIVLLVVIVYLVYVGVQNMFANLAAQNIASGFDFIKHNAGFGISQSLLEYNQAESSYGKVYVVGLLNTISIAFIGIIFATILGFIIGIARLSHNFVVRAVAGGDRAEQRRDAGAVGLAVVGQAGPILRSRRPSTTLSLLPRSRRR